MITDLIYYLSTDFIFQECESRVPTLPKDTTTVNNLINYELNKKIYITLKICLLLFIRIKINSMNLIITIIRDLAKNIASLELTHSR